MIEKLPSHLLENAVEQLSQLPGVGRKTALRLVLYMLRQPTDNTDKLTDALHHVRHDICHCRVCHNISDTEVCPICADQRRDSHTVCVVENVQDVMAIENTRQYNGLYHVLGGIISPMDGIAPGDIEIDSLVERVQNATPPAFTSHDGCNPPVLLSAS